jgi:hypothetical protein
MYILGRSISGPIDKNQIERKNEPSPTDNLTKLPRNYVLSATLFRI